MTAWPATTPTKFASHHSRPAVQLVLTTSLCTMAQQQPLFPDIKPSPWSHIVQMLLQVMQAVSLTWLQ
jgi:hypothetical protein